MHISEQPMKNENVRADLKNALDARALGGEQEISVVVVTGASGAGKSHLVDQAREDFTHDLLQYIGFDEIGIPTNEEIEKLYGGGEGFREAKTREWARRMQDGEFEGKSLFILDGSLEPHLALEALKAEGIENAKVVVCDVPDEVRNYRLITLRKQAWLATPEMSGFADLMREQGNEQGALMLDTSELSTPDAIDMVLGEALKLLG